MQVYNARSHGIRGRSIWLQGWQLLPEWCGVFAKALLGVLICLTAISINRRHPPYLTDSEVAQLTNIYAIIVTKAKQLNNTDLLAYLMLRHSLTVTAAFIQNCDIPAKQQNI